MSYGAEMFIVPLNNDCILLKQKENNFTLISDFWNRAEKVILENTQYKICKTKPGGFANIL